MHSNARFLANFRVDGPGSPFPTLVSGNVGPAIIDGFGVQWVRQAVEVAGALSVPSVIDLTLPSIDSAITIVTGNASFLYGFNSVDGFWYRLNQTGTDLDAVAPVITGALEVASRNFLYDGANFTRARTNSTINQTDVNPIAENVALVGNWTQFDAPAPATIATSTRLGSPGQSHVLTSISGVVANSAGLVYLLIRDGASGVGAILWQRAFDPTLTSYSSVDLSGLSIVGTPGNDMTVEFSATGAGVIETVAFTGYTAI